MAAPVVDTFGAAARLEGVPSALASARDGVDALLRDRGLRRTTPALTAESLLRGAVASARLSGSDSTLDEVRDGRGDPLARRAARLYAGLLALVPVIARSPLQALARMHALAAAGAVATEQLGRPRADQPSAALLHRLSALLLAPTDAPAIAVAGLAHGEVAGHAPFGSADDLVARALERLLLVARGVDPTSVLVPEAGHLALRDGYQAALASYRSGDAAGQRTWLLHTAAALGQAVEHSPMRRL